MASSKTKVTSGRRGAAGRRARGDDLEAYVRERSRRNPDLPRLMAEVAERKRLLTELANARRQSGATQTEVAARMGTSGSAVARLERGEMNPTVTTLQRFAAAIGKRLLWRLVEQR